MGKAMAATNNSKANQTAVARKTPKETIIITKVTAENIPLRE